MTVSRNGDRHFEITCAALESQLPAHFKAWLSSTLRHPSAASSVVLEYLDYGGPSIFVRGLQRAGDPDAEFWLQISFSGCAGEAQVSASVAAHWAARWHHANEHHLRTAYLEPFGFTPDPVEGVERNDPFFIPADNLGYAEVASPESRTRERVPLFIVDQAVQKGDPLLDRLEEQLAPLLGATRCRCQICDQQVHEPHESGRPTSGCS